MKTKWLKKEKLSVPINAQPGDTIKCKYKREYRNEKGKLLKTETHELAEATLTENVSVDEIRIFEFKDWENLKKGFGGVFGESKK